ncbi:MAG: hypothetical protein JRC90_10140 [Deltaproteobacteria bacterium]|nr:hypothetical protein [Deltaproteobacteria bacterium]
MSKNLTGAIAVCVTVAIMLIVGITVLGSIYDTMPDVTQSVDAETFNSGEFNDWSYDEANATGQGPWVQLAHANIVNGSEKVYNSTTTFTRDTDYKMNYTDGAISVLASSTKMYNNTDYSIDYDWVGVSEMATDVVPVIGNAFTLMSVVIIVMAAGVILTVLTGFGRGK